MKYVIIIIKHLAAAIMTVFGMVILIIIFHAAAGTIGISFWYVLAAALVGALFIGSGTMIGARK